MSANSKTQSALPFPTLILILMTVIFVSLIVHIAVGTVDLGLHEVVLALFGHPRLDQHEQIVTLLRLPRALVAILAGAMLGTAGAMLQIVTRNALAEPGLLGVSGGAVLAIIIAIVIGISNEAAPTLPLIGFLGGLISGGLVYILSINEGTDPIRLILIGVLVAGTSTSLTAIILLFGNQNEVKQIIPWLIGSTNGRVWAQFWIILPYGTVGLFLALTSSRIANILQLGDDVAKGLGLQVEITRFWLLFVAAFLTAGAVSVVGAIGLIGLIGPHIARRIEGADARRLIPLSALLTALLLLWSDIVARTLDIAALMSLSNISNGSNVGLPVGAITALIGVPFFLYLLLKPTRSM